VEAEGFPLEAVAFVLGIDELTEVGSTCEEELNILTLEVLLPEVQGVEEAALGLVEVRGDHVPVPMLYLYLARLARGVGRGVGVDEQDVGSFDH
jgi:hypothetical protein